MHPHFFVKQLFNKNGVAWINAACLKFRNEFSGFIEAIDGTVGHVIGGANIEIAIIRVYFKQIDSGCFEFGG